MSRTTLRNVGIIVLVALAVAVIPGGSATAELVLAIISLGFIAAIGFLGYRLYMEHKFTLWSMSDQHRALPTAVSPSPPGRWLPATGCSTAGSARSCGSPCWAARGSRSITPGWSHAGTEYR